MSDTVTRIKILALDYRPQNFTEIKGQPSTVRQLKGAIENNTLGHALIFAGTRGCGKTTTARIVAKTLNCVEGNNRPRKTLKDLKKDLDDLQGIKTLDWTTLPCGKCISCREIGAGVSLSVSEIDAASNNGVDSIREIIENLRYSVRGHRVIILDEAHMLSKSAFNSLLKTLEEPPPNTTFILSTTEPHKLLPTVRSRCSTYEFPEVDVDTLATHYAEIARREGLGLSDEVLRDIAIKAEGSVRDGLSVLQNYLSGEELESSSLLYYDLLQAVYRADLTCALERVIELRQKEDGRVIIQTLEKWLHNCSLENFGMKTPARQYFPAGNVPAFDLSHLQNLFNICLDVERNFSATPNSKSVLEMGIIRLCL